MKWDKIRSCEASVCVRGTISQFHVRQREKKKKKKRESRAPQKPSVINAIHRNVQCADL